MQKLRMQLNDCTDGEQRKLLQTESNQVSHAIRRRAKQCASDAVDKKVQEIENLKDNAKMFRAVKLLHRGRQQAPVVFDEQQKIVMQEDQAIAIISQHFEKAFKDTNYSDTSKYSLSAPLDMPITPSEVSLACKRLNNNRACGPDNIPAELFKYGPEILYSYLSTLYNKMAESGEQLNIGSGLLIPLQKPGKQKGPVSNLRPIVLLTVLRKTLSLIVLKRIQGKVNSYISQYQSGFRPNRSTADLVWCHRFLAARCLKYQQSLYVLGIDMSKAFDTISRNKLMSILESFLSTDEVRLIHMLISGTSLQTRLGKSVGEPFLTTGGTPQGDSLSPVLFTVYLEAALREVHDCMVPRPAMDVSLCLPPKLAFADDVDFVSSSDAYLRGSLPVIGDTLRNWNLNMNEQKTEHTHIHRAADRVAEEWRNVRKLGSLMGEPEDLSRRIQLAGAVLQKSCAIWTRGHILNERSRIRLYKALVLPVLTYNMGTWGLTVAQLNKLDSFHRRQLRTVVGIRHPQHITNADLYKRTESGPISSEVKRATWRLFGHVLRSATDSPAQLAMVAYFRCQDQPKYRGRPCSCLPVIIRHDLQRTGLTFHTEADLNHVRQVAQDRKAWQELFDQVRAGE